MSADTKLLLELGRRLEFIRYSRLPQKTVDKAKIAVLNFFGGCLAGARDSLVLAEKALWKSQNCGGDCVILGSRERMSPLAAASVNALMGQIFLLEDCHENTISHPGVVVIPIALALGQSLKTDGRRVIEAIVAGYEGLGRIGSVLIAPGFPDYGLRPASTMAPFGGAAAAAKMMNLPAEGFAGALSIAGNTASGVMEFVNAGTPDICIQNCFAAQNSMKAAMLAANGIEASPAILDGRFGLGRALNRRDLDWSRALEERPDFMIDESFIKRFPGCGHVLATAQASSSLVGRYKINPDAVEKVTVWVPRHRKEFPGVDNPGPYSGTISAMMSHQFMAASALVFGEISVSTVKKYHHPEITRMAQRVFIEIDEASPDGEGGHEAGSRLELRLNNGETFTDFQEDQLPMNAEEVIVRFKKHAESFMKENQADEVVDKTLNLDSLESVGSLMNLLEAEN